ncbi:MAG: tRNA (guanosine(46)-N7)-methyltransferase TrmB [Deltaproteobacteria bacterium]|nr:tRNA (guanosine(46)-N7)-methyltransferase TrmB [Deltaproteobacteria bacterium]
MRLDPADFSAPPPTWQDIFGNANPVEVEIGFGKGSFLLALAKNHPERNFFGVEYAKRWSFRLALLIERNGPANVLAIHADFTCLVRTMIRPESVSVYHLYFPDPWWKRRHQERRLFHHDFAAALARTLRPGGKILLASDVQSYFAEIVQQFSQVPELSRFSWERDHVNKRGKPILTDFERKYRQEGRPLFYAGLRKAEESSICLDPQ